MKSLYMMSRSSACFSERMRQSAAPSFKASSRGGYAEFAHFSKRCEIIMEVMGQWQRAGCQSSGWRRAADGGLGGLLALGRGSLGSWFHMHYIKKCARVVVCAFFNLYFLFNFFLPRSYFGRVQLYMRYTPRRATRPSHEEPRAPSQAPDPNPPTTCPTSNDVNNKQREERSESLLLFFLHFAACFAVI